MGATHGQAAECDPKKRHTLGERVRALQVHCRSDAVRSRRRVEVVGMKREKHYIAIGDVLSRRLDRRRWRSRKRSIRYSVVASAILQSPA